MTFRRQDSVATHVGTAGRGREGAGAFLRTYRRQPSVPWQQSLSLPTPHKGLTGAVLACLAPMAFCLGLVGLAVSSRFEATAPRWFILAYGLGCVVVTLLGLLLSGPPRLPRPSSCSRP